MYSGMNPDFQSRLKALIDASGGRLSVTDGVRTLAQQQDVFNRKPNLAARPSPNAPHVRGIAADLAGDLEWAHQNAPKYGLEFPMLNPKGRKVEPWHVQLPKANLTNPLQGMNPVSQFMQSQPTAVPPIPSGLTPAAPKTSPNQNTMSLAGYAPPNEAGNALVGQALTPEQQHRVNYLNGRDDKAIPNQIALALAKNPKDADALKRLSALSPFGQKITAQKAEEYRKGADLPPMGKTTGQPIPGAPPYIMGYASNTGQNVGSGSLPSEVAANLVHGPEGAKALAVRKGFFPAVEKFAYSLADPQNVALLAGGWAAGELAPILKPVISGIFAGYAGNEARKKAQAGDIGGAVLDVLMMVGAGAHAGKAIGDLIPRLGNDFAVPEPYSRTEVMNNRSPRMADAFSNGIGLSDREVKRQARATGTKPAVRVQVPAATPKTNEGFLSDDEAAQLNNGSGATSAAPAPLPGAEPAVLDQQPATSKSSATQPIPAESLTDVARPTRPATTTEPASLSSQAPPSDVSNVAAGDAVHPFEQTSARKDSMARDLETLGLDQLPDPERKGWEASIEGARSKGYDTADGSRGIVEEVRNKPRSLNDEETAGLVLRGQEIKNRMADVETKLGEATTDHERHALSGLHDDLLREFGEIADAARKSGTEKGRTLAAQKLTIGADFSLERVIGRATKAKGEALTSQEVADLRETVKQHEAAHAEYERKLAEVQSENEAHKARIAELEAQGKSSGEASDIAGKEQRVRVRVATKEQLKAEWEDLSSQLQKALGKQSLNVGPKQLVDAAPIIGKMAKNLAKRTGLQAEAVIDAIHDIVKTHLPDVSRADIADAISKYGKRVVSDETRLKISKTSVGKSIADLERRIKANDFSKKERPKGPVDEELLNAREKRDDLRRQLKDKEEKLRKKTWAEKASNALIGLKLAAPSVYEKLLGASAWAAPTRSVEELSGWLAGKTFAKGAAKVTPEYATGPLEGLGSGVRRLVSRDTVRDIIDTVRTRSSGGSRIDRAAGVASHGESITSLVGSTHGAFKAPLTSFEYGKRKTVYDNLSRAAGQDPSDPVIQMQNEAKAAKDALDIKLQDDNQLVNGINRSLSSWEKSPHDSLKAASVLANMFIGIRRVGYNFVRNTADMTGLGLVRGAVIQRNVRVRTARSIAEALKGGPLTPEEVKTMNLPTPEESKAMLKAYQRGGVGLLAAWIGITQPKFFQAGGFYQEERGKKGQQPANGLKAGEIALFGRKLPKVLTHGTFPYAVQFWSTLADQWRKGGPARGVVGAAGGLVAESPGQFGLEQAVQAEKGGARAPVVAGKFLAGQAIGGLGQISEYMDRKPNGDVQKRYPRGVGETFMEKLPGLRKMVPNQPERAVRVSIPQTPEQRKMVRERRQSMSTK